MPNPLRFLRFKGLKVAVRAELRVTTDSGAIIPVKRDVGGLIRRPWMYEHCPLQENWNWDAQVLGMHACRAK